MLQVTRSIVGIALSLLAAPSAVAQDFSPSHLEAAEDLLGQMDMPRILAESIDSMLEAQLQQNPQLGPYEDIMTAFLHRHMSWDSLREPFLLLYAEAFTEQELREMVAFYQTPTGRKAAELTPVLMARGTALGQQVVAEHMPELEQSIRERMEELSESD